MKDNRRMEGVKVANGKSWKESSKKGKFPPCSHCKTTLIKKKTVGLKESPLFCVDFVER